MKFKLEIKSTVPTTETITANSAERARAKAAWLVNALYNGSKRAPAWTLERLAE